MHTIKTEHIESLRHILEREQNRIVELDEAQEIGESILDFIELLASSDEVDE